jgi:hypothetical protein
MQSNPQHLSGFFFLTSLSSTTQSFIHHAVFYPPHSFLSTMSAINFNGNGRHNVQNNSAPHNIQNNYASESLSPYIQHHGHNPTHTAPITNHTTMSPINFNGHGQHDVQNNSASHNIQNNWRQNGANANHTNSGDSTSVNITNANNDSSRAMHGNVGMLLRHICLSSLRTLTLH